jgi:cytochrome c oxidase cbb3-type subunit 3
MSDFVHSFWSHYIAWITLAGILACVVLLWLTSRKKLAGSADNTTGHVWDEDLREMNNPLPLWWVGMFVITIVFALFYLVLYPGLGSSEGSLDDPDFIVKDLLDNDHTEDELQVLQRMFPKTFKSKPQ